MPGMVFDNAIAWAHFKLRGGWKQVGIITGGYMLLAGLAVFMTSRLSVASALLGWTNMLLGLQFLLLALFGGSVIGSAIRKDINSGLMESHRLMPMAPSAVIVGYIAGPPCQLLFLSMATLLLGCATSAWAGLPVERWVMANIVVFLFILFVWVVIAYAAFLAKNATALVVVVMSVGGASGGFLLAAIPGLMILVTPLTGRTVFGMLDSSDVLSKGYAFSFVGQVAVGSIFFAGAIRKYRQPDAPALGPLLGFLLLTAWAGLSVVGILDWDDFAPRFIRRNDVPMNVQIISSLTAALFLALIPVTTTARSWSDWRMARTSVDAPPLRRPLAPPLAILIGGCITLGLAVCCLPPDASLATMRTMTLSTGIVIISFLACLSYVARILYRVTRKVGMLTAVIVVAWFLLPSGVEFIRYSATTGNDGNTFFTGISTASPIGALVAVWMRYDVSVVGGLIVQLIVAAVPMFLFYSTARRSASDKGKRELNPV